MKSADLALKLMMTNKRSEAIALAEELDDLNAERKKEQDSAIREATEQVNKSDKVIVVHGKWHEGIVGIVAGRLVELYKKPALVVAEVDNGVLKGSGRSFGDFSLAEAMQNMSEGLLLSGGGHAGACGLSIKAEDFDTFKTEINEYYDGLGLIAQERFLRQTSDVILGDFSKLELELYDEIQLLEPFGEGNQEPIFEITGKIKNVRVLKEQHLALTVVDSHGNEMKMMAFYAPEDWLNVGTGEHILVQFTLMKNEWRGNVKLEANLISLERIS
jgi:single-stranded-DNA-specific exonuclease